MNNQTQTQIFRSFDSVLHLARLPMIVVYLSPVDYPGMYVARMFDLAEPTRYFALGNELQHIRRLIPISMTHIERDKDDVASIIEIWI
jgi:hypothetical protein